MISYNSSMSSKSIGIFLHKIYVYKNVMCTFVLPYTHTGKQLYNEVSVVCSYPYSALPVSVVTMRISSGFYHNKILIH